MKIVFAGVLCLALAATMAIAQVPDGAKGGSPLMDPKCPEMNQKAPDVFKAKFTTSQGDFTVEAHRNWSPNGADRFFNLVTNGFYNDCRFFRVMPGFMAQVGVSGDPRISVVWGAATIPDDPVIQGNQRGLVTFAKTNAPNSRSTQIFINFADNPNLDASGFAAFGRIDDAGMKVVDKLYGGYGDGAPKGAGPDQRRLKSDGNAYLLKNFPKLDYIKKAVILE